MDESNGREARGQLIEEGTAYEKLAERGVTRSVTERFDVVVIGGGQAGLSVGYHLKRRGVRFVILDASARVGDSWRQRWDSLRLFTPAKLDGLDGLPFPAAPHDFPTKDEMADYLESYARHFALPVRSGVRVQSVTRAGDSHVYVVETPSGRIEAQHVVIAMASYQRQRVPVFAGQLGPDVVQIHSSEYKGPAQLREGPVLVVGAGNSGAEIALELARRGHQVWMSGRDVGHLPFRIEGFWARLFLMKLILRVLFHHLFTVRTPMGRKMRAKMAVHGGPLIRVKPRQLLAAGVERVARVAGVETGRPVLEDGRVLDVANVVWCTGYDNGFGFVELPDAFGADGQPIHDRGVVTTEPGLYFVGMQFLYAASSTMIHGVGRDAARVAGVIAERCVAYARGSGASSSPRLERSLRSLSRANVTSAST